MVQRAKRPCSREKHKDVEYDQCRNCDGLWFDALEAEDLVDLESAADIDTGDTRQGAEPNKTWKVKCPACNVPMLPTHDIEQPHIRLEACPSCHGTFFDAGEFKDFCEETVMDRVKDWFAKKDQDVATRLEVAHWQSYAVGCCARTAGKPPPHRLDLTGLHA